MSVANNKSKRKVLVMKFGGTSVADAKAMARVIGIIKRQSIQPHVKTVVVVSAISEATNILTQVAVLAGNGNSSPIKKILTAFRARHLNMAKKLISKPEFFTPTENRISGYFAELETTLQDVVKKKLQDSSFAQILAYGELLSSTILHQAMLTHGIKTTLIDARNIIITDNNHQQGKPLLKEMTRMVPPLINRHLDHGEIVLTQGFIASTKAGATTILGREGSDYSASLIGMVMDAYEIQIWTDVDGILTADPRKVTDAKLIPFLSFREAAELSYFGAKVIHPLTIEPAAKKNIPVRILNSTNLDPKQKGTLVTSDTKDKSAQILSITYKENIQETKIPRKKDHALVSIIGKNLHQTASTTKNIGRILDGFNIRVIVNDSSDTSFLLAIQKKDLSSVLKKLHAALFGAT